MPSGTGEPSTVVVTGATGMVGRHVVWRLLEAGYRVRAQVRAGSDRLLFDGLDVALVEADLTQPATLPPVVDGVDYVVHAAAVVGNGHPAEDYQQVNVTGLQNLLVATRKNAGLRRWIQISSLDVYAPRDHRGTDETEPIDLESLEPYARSKAEADLRIAEFVADGLPAVILRPGLVYGPGDRRVLPWLIEQIAAHRLRLVGGGVHKLHNTSVRNLADAILPALERDAAAGEVFHITDGERVSAAELTAAIAESLDCPPPAESGWLARWMGQSRQTPHRLFGFELDFSIDKARRVLGYEPQVDFAVGIREALEAAVC